LYRHYQDNPALEVFLLDRTKLTGIPHYGLKIDGEFYNSLAVSERVAPVLRLLARVWTRITLAQRRRIDKY
jgi:hypothetical protein